MYFDEGMDRVFKICHAGDAVGSSGYSSIPWLPLYYPDAPSLVGQNDPHFYVCPTSVKASSNIISRSFDDMNGDFQDWPIANKAKINWIFDAVSDAIVGVDSYGQPIRKPAADLVHDFVQNYIFEKINHYKSRVFLISGWAPGYGKCWGKFYLGTPTNFNSEGVSQSIKNTGASVKFELHWIEVGDATTHIQSILDTTSSAE